MRIMNNANNYNNVYVGFLRGRGCVAITSDTLLGLNKSLNVFDNTIKIQSSLSRTICFDRFSDFTLPEPLSFATAC